MTDLAQQVGWQAVVDTGQSSGRSKGTGGKMTDLARCEKCGYEGIYGDEVVDTGYYSPVTKLDTLKPMCRDIEACYQRQLERDRKVEEVKDARD